MNPNGKSGFSFSDAIFTAGLAVAAALIPFAIAKRHCFQEVPADRSSLQVGIGILLAVLAAFLVGFNLYTSFLRPWMFRRAHGGFEGYQHASGAPVLGSVLIGIASLLLPSSIWIGVLLLVLYFVDPMGICVAAMVFLRECFSRNSNSA